MNPEEYSTMRQQEDAHWWYRTLRSAVLRQIRTQLGDRSRSARVLDAGCGTGGMLAAMRASFWNAELTGVDLEEQAVEITRARQVANAVIRANVNALPFGPDCFDAAVSLDVLYHANVEEGAALAEMKRVLRPDGLLIVNVPAFEALRGPHDVAVHGRRRYTPRQLAALAVANGLRVEHWTCWNMLLSPLLWAWRRIGRLAGSDASDVRPAPAWLNMALATMLRAEWTVADRVALPWGSSLFAVLRKPRV